MRTQSLFISPKLVSMKEIESARLPLGSLQGGGRSGQREKTGEGKDWRGDWSLTGSPRAWSTHSGEVGSSDLRELSRKLRKNRPRSGC